MGYGDGALCGSNSGLCPVVGISIELLNLWILLPEQSVN
jgi:hypothetical protein